MEIKMSDTNNSSVDVMTVSTSSVNDNAQSQLANIRFCDERLQQLRNELAVADTARGAYAAALKRELQA
jgi:hypothetical protein